MNNLRTATIITNIPGERKKVRVYQSTFDESLWIDMDNNVYSENQLAFER